MTNEDSETTITDDDISTLRVLLHNVKGITTVSSSNPYVPDEQSDRY